MIEAHPEYAGPLYNLACCESLAGRTDDAIKHLRLAIDRHESFRSLAAEDSDFDPIRDEAAFKELVQGKAAETTGDRLTPFAQGTFLNAGPGDGELSGGVERRRFVGRAMRDLVLPRRALSAGMVR